MSVGRLFTSTIASRDHIFLDLVQRCGVKLDWKNKEKARGNNTGFRYIKSGRPIIMPPPMIGFCLTRLFVCRIHTGLTRE